VSAGTVLSLTSQEGADSIASILAQQGLECFFTAEGEAHCADEETVASPQSNALEGIRGKNVLVPRGMVQTLESQAVASALAAALAESFLDCFWLNREMTYACDDIDADPTNSEQRENHVTGVYPGAMVAANKSGQRVYVTALEATLAMLASPIKSPTYSVTVEAGEFSSPDGQAAVDTLAAVFASTQLSCVYCNPRINPVCVPTDGSGNLPVTLAFPVAANPTTMELPLDTARVDATWSIDATAGIPGIVYVEGEVEEDDWTPAAGFFAEDPESPVKTLLCSPDPFEAVAVADIAGMVPIAQLTPASREDTCQFTNDAHYAACRDADLPTPPPAGGVSVTIPAGGYNAYFSTRSLPGPNADLLVDSYVTIPAGAFTANSKATANQLAKVAALALLDCFFESPELKVYCGAGAGATLPSAETYTTLAGAPVTIPTTSPGFVASDPTHPVSEDSVGYYAPTPDATAPALAATPVIIPYGYSRSYISPQDAMDQAVLVGAGQLNCFFKAVVVAYCTPNADTRAVMTDGRYNGAPVLSEGLISTDPEDEIPGQVARFKYAGAVAFDPLTGERTNTPGIAVPSASGVAVSSITQADAHTNALADARSKLDCTHTNWTRNNFRCPDAKDILFQPHTVGVDVFDGVSTKDANIQAEALARSSTVCAPCSPFRLAVYGEYGVDPVWSFCGGAATFWGLSTWGTGVGAKLNSCKSGIEDNFTIKEVFWQTCGVPLPSTLPVATGTTLYWVKVACCEEVLPYPAGPSLLLISQASSYTEENVASPSFYPTEETATLNEDTAAEYIYVGAIVGGRSGADDGRAAVAYQHMNENLRFFGGGADSDPCYFGEIITVPADGVIPAAKAIRGGVIYGGGANKDVEHFTLDLETDAEMLVWLEVGITANTEDGVLMPHLETCDDPTWETGTIAGGYPDNTTPDKVTGDGVRIVPIGKLIIKEGAAAFERTGCGHITLGFCPPNNLPIVRV
jgi:hypothetical protein